MCGEERGGEDAGGDVWKEMDADMAGGGVNAGRCWLERRYLDLGWGLEFVALAAYRRRSEPPSSKSSGSAGSPDGATRRRCLGGLVVGVYIERRFPFLRGDRRGATGE